MRHVCVHGVKCGTDAIVAQRSQPAGGPIGLIGVGAQHMDEQDLCEMVQDQRAADGGGLDLADQQFAQVCEQLASRICGMDVHERRQNIDQDRGIRVVEREMPTAQYVSSSVSVPIRTVPFVALAHSDFASRGFAVSALART